MVNNNTTKRRQRRSVPPGIGSVGRHRFAAPIPFETGSAILLHSNLAPWPCPQRGSRGEGAAAGLAKEPKPGLRLPAAPGGPGPVARPPVQSSDLPLCCLNWPNQALFCAFCYLCAVRARSPLRVVVASHADLRLKEAKQGSHSPSLFSSLPLLPRLCSVLFCSLSLDCCHGREDPTDTVDPLGSGGCLPSLPLPSLYESVVVVVPPSPPLTAATEETVLFFLCWS